MEHRSRLGGEVGSLQEPWCTALGGARREGCQSRGLLARPWEHEQGIFLPLQESGYMIQWRFKSGQPYIQSHSKPYTTVVIPSNKKLWIKHTGEKEESRNLLTCILERRDQNILPLPLTVREFWKTGYLLGQNRVNLRKSVRVYFYIYWKWVWTKLFENSQIIQSLLVDYEQWIW